MLAGRIGVVATSQLRAPVDAMGPGLSADQRYDLGRLGVYDRHVGRGTGGRARDRGQREHRRRYPPTVGAHWSLNGQLARVEEPQAHELVTGRQSHRDVLE